MRQKLTAAIKGAFLKNGFSFMQGFLPASGASLQLPALWLTPVQLAGKGGRKEGTMIYRVTLYLLVSAAGLTEQTKEQKWEELESAALASSAALFNDPDVEVIGLTGLQLVPNQFSLTSSGEIALQVSFNIEINYYNGAA